MQQIPTELLNDISGGLACPETIGYAAAIMGGAFFVTTGCFLPVLHNPRCIYPLSAWVLSGALGGAAIGLIYCALAPVIEFMSCDP